MSWPLSPVCLILKVKYKKKSYVTDSEKPIMVPLLNKNSQYSNSPKKSKYHYFTDHTSPQDLWLLEIDSKMVRYHNKGKHLAKLHLP